MDKYVHNYVLYIVTCMCIYLKCATIIYPERSKDKSYFCKYVQICLSKEETNTKVKNEGRDIFPNLGRDIFPNLGLCSVESKPRCIHNVAFEREWHGWFRAVGRSPNRAEVSRKSTQSVVSTRTVFVKLPVVRVRFWWKRIGKTIL